MLNKKAKSYVIEDINYNEMKEIKSWIKSKYGYTDCGVRPLFDNDGEIKSYEWFIQYQSDHIDWEIHGGERQNIEDVNVILIKILDMFKK